MRKGQKHSKKTRKKMSQHHRGGRSRLTPEQEIAHGANPNRDKPADQWEDATDILLGIGSVFDRKNGYPEIREPYGVFHSLEEAWKWWQKHRKKWVKTMSGNEGTRPNIFWEMEFGLRYPKNEIELINNHNLWRPGERETLISWGKQVPELPEQICRWHAHGYPVVFPEAPPVKFVNGGFKSAVCCECDLKEGPCKEHNRPWCDECAESSLV